MESRAAPPSLSYSTSGSNVPATIICPAPSSNLTAPSYRSRTCLPHAYARRLLDQISAAHDEDVLAQQQRELPSDLEVEGCRSRCVDTQLHDTNIGVRIRMPEHRPGPLIQSPRGIQGDRQRSEQSLHASARAESPGAVSGD